MITTEVGQKNVRGDIVCNHDTEAAATAVVITKTGVAAFRWCLHGVQWSYSASPTGGKLTIASGATILYETDIIAGGPGGHNIYLEAANGTDLVITLASGAGTVVGKLNVQVVSKPA
jgi:hypothetical protein